MNSIPEILRQLNELSKVELVAGEYRGREPGGLRALVDFEGGRVPVQPSTEVAPAVNETVWVLRIDDAALMLGPTVMKPGEGVVVSSTGSVAVVNTSIGQLTVEQASGVTYPPGTVVKLLWSEGGWIAGVKAPASAPVVPPAPGGGGARVTQVFTAVDSASYRSTNGWWTGDVWASSSNRGCWFYGTKIRDTIPVSAVIVSVEVYLPPPRNLTGARNFGTHSFTSRPAGPPTVSTVTNLSGTSGWVAVPTSIGDFLKANVGGVGFNTGGNNTWPGVQSDGQSGALRITYTS